MATETADDIRDAELAQSAQAGDDAARDELLSRTEPLVRTMASRRRSGLSPFDDLMQEGLMGVVSAIAAYDPAGGRTFRHHAMLRAKAKMWRSILRDRSLIRIPDHADRHAVPAFAPDGDNILAMIPAADTMADSIGRAIALDAALRQLAPMECWVICERYGLSRPSSLNRRIFPESNSPGRRYYHRSVQDLAAECGLTPHRLREIESAALARLNSVLDADAIEALAGRVG